VAFNPDADTCWYCGLSWTPARTAQTDHMIPRSRGGGDQPENIVLACTACNGSKHDSTPEEWRAVLERTTDTAWGEEDPCKEAKTARQNRKVNGRMIFAREHEGPSTRGMYADGTRGFSLVRINLMPRRHWSRRRQRSNANLVGIDFDLRSALRSVTVCAAALDGLVFLRPDGTITEAHHAALREAWARAVGLREALMSLASLQLPVTDKETRDLYLRIEQDLAEMKVT